MFVIIPSVRREFFAKFQTVCLADRSDAVFKTVGAE